MKTNADIFREILFRMRYVVDKSFTENQNTHFMFKNFFPENRAVYDIMRKNTVEPYSSQMIYLIRRMRIACWIIKATNTHCYSTATMVARTRISFTSYVYCLSCSLA
jgi:hypothetical protein